MNEDTKEETIQPVSWLAIVEAFRSQQPEPEEETGVIPATVPPDFEDRR